MTNSVAEALSNSNAAPGRIALQITFCICRQHRYLAGLLHRYLTLCCPSQAVPITKILHFTPTTIAITRHGFRIVSPSMNCWRVEDIFHLSLFLQDLR